MFNKKKKKPQISPPCNFEHRVHTGFDKNAGRYVGLPLQWASIVGNNQILKSTNRPLPLVDPSEITPTEILDLKTIVRGDHKMGDHKVTQVPTHVPHKNGLILPKTSNVARSNSLRSSSPPRLRRDMRANVPPSVPEEQNVAHYPTMRRDHLQKSLPNNQEWNRHDVNQQTYQNQGTNGNNLVSPDYNAQYRQQQLHPSPVGSMNSISQRPHPQPQNAGYHHNVQNHQIQMRNADQNQNLHNKMNSRASSSSGGNISMSQTSVVGQSAANNTAVSSGPGKQDQRLTHEQVIALILIKFLDNNKYFNNISFELHYKWLYLLEILVMIWINLLRLVKDQQEQFVLHLIEEVVDKLQLKKWIYVSNNAENCFLMKWL